MVAVAILDCLCYTLFASRSSCTINLVTKGLVHIYIYIGGNGGSEGGTEGGRERGRDGFIP